MENRVPLKLAISIAAVAALLAPLSSRAYYLPAHRLLTDEAVKFFNAGRFNIQIGSADTVAIIQGAQDEDDFPRYFNHFYDPTTNQGLHYGIDWESSKGSSWNSANNDFPSISL